LIDDNRTLSLLWRRVAVIAREPSGNFVRDFPEEALTPLKPFAECLDEAFEALAALDLRGGLHVARQWRRDRQPESLEAFRNLQLDVCEFASSVAVYAK
jgi:hypothetical protein